MDWALLHWNDSDHQRLLDYVESCATDKQLEVSTRLIPNVEPTFGVSMRILKDIAAQISKGNPVEFLAVDGGVIHEEKILSAYVIGKLNISYAEFWEYLTDYATRADNWAVCDMVIHFKLAKKYQTELWSDLDYFLKSSNQWYQRIGLVLLLKFFLEDEYIDEILRRIAKTQDEYYVNVAKAWLLSYAAKKYSMKIIDYLISGPVNKETYQLTIRKIKSLKSTSDETKKIVSGLERKFE